MTEKLIKTKERVKNYGEVFTPYWMVQKMIDSPGIKEECENINSLFLEPAAGDGNFLVAILIRKIKSANEISENTMFFLQNSLKALSSLYGIELLEDNSNDCRKNIFNTYKLECEKIIGENLDTKTLKIAREIINDNIITGNFLTRKTIEDKNIIIKRHNFHLEKGEYKHIKTEFTLDEIENGIKKTEGSKHSEVKEIIYKEITLEDFLKGS